MFKDENKLRVGVVGFGGFSKFFIPHIFSQLQGGVEVVVYDKNDLLKTEMKDMGCVPSSLEDVVQSDYLILSVPSQFLGVVLEDVSNIILEKGCSPVVVDVCSVKVHPVELMKSILPECIEFISTHPIFGPQSGKNGLEGLPFVVCSDSRCSYEIYQNFIRFLKVAGLIVIEKTAQEHDKEMAYVQGLTHLIARTLKNLSIPDTSLATKAYRHLYEAKEMLGNDSMDLFLSIQNDNPFASQVRDGFLKELNLLLEKVG